MNKTIKAAVIGAGATIISAIIGVIAGQNIEQNNIQNEMNDVFNIFGNDNDVTINDVKELIEDYQDLQKQNESLTAQNIKYFDELSEANMKLDDFNNQTNQELEELKSQINDIPIFNYSSLSLSIDGEDIAINQNNSMVTINGREYVSREIAEKLLSDNTNIVIKDNTIFIGKVVADKANLSQQWIVDTGLVSYENSVIDSYGNTHTNTIYFNKNRNYSRESYVVYNINRAFSYLDFKVAVPKTSNNDSYGVIVIKDGSDVIYTSEEICLTTEPFEVKNIPISNCSLLTINYNFQGYSECILYDAIVYN